MNLKIAKFNLWIPLTSSQRSLFLTTLLLSFISISLQFFSERTLHHLSFWTEKILNFEIWRFYSAHLIHFNWLHLTINLVVLWFLVRIFFWKLSVRLFGLSLIVICTSIDAGLFFVGPTNQEYLGLSGVLYGLAIVGAWANQSHHWIKRIILIGVILLKVIYDYFFGFGLQNVEQAYGFIVATDAHLYGAVSGLCIAFYLFGYRRQTQNINQ